MKRHQRSGVQRLPNLKPLLLVVTGYLCAGTMSQPAPVLASATVAAPVGHSRVTLSLPDAAIASIPAARSDVVSLPPLIVLLHGAGQSPEQMIDRFAADPGCADAVLLAPKSIGQTWDVIWMAQRQMLEGASRLSSVFEYAGSKDADRVMSAISGLARQIKTDPARQLLLGFSDGATYALALGTARDRPFTAVAALSPGLAVVPARPARDRPVLVMHGKKDRSLPFEFTRSEIVPALRSAHLAVRFLPFDGGHEIPQQPLQVCSLALTDSR
jgi:phospholipase/carboxylesterase